MNSKHDDSPIEITLRCSSEQFSERFTPLALAYQNGQSIIIPMDSLFLMCTLVGLSNSLSNGECSIQLKLRVSQRCMGLAVIASGVIVQTTEPPVTRKPVISEVTPATGGLNNGIEEKHTGVETCPICDGTGYRDTEEDGSNVCMTCYGTGEV